MFKKLIAAVFVVLLIVSTAVAFEPKPGQFNEQVTIINKRLAGGCADPDRLKGWRDGLKTEYGCDLDHLESIFVLTEAEQVDDKTILTGTVTTTGYAYKNKQKVKVVQVVTVIYLMKDTIVEGVVVLDSTKKMFNGWAGIDI